MHFPVNCSLSAVFDPYNCNLTAIRYVLSRECKISVVNHINYYTYENANKV